jgi:hypothetical protein
MQTTTKPRDPEAESRTGAPRRRRLGATLLTAGALSVVGVLAAAAELTSSAPRPRSTSSTVVVETPIPTTPTAAPFENDFSLCALGVDGIEATYPGPLVAQTVSRYATSCSPAEGGAFPARND